MTRRGGIEGPDVVPAGTTEIQVTSPDSTRLTVVNLNTGEEKTVPVDRDGRATIPVPKNAPGGTFLVVLDPDDRNRTLDIEIVSSSDHVSNG
jgi:hypothetical protein